MSREDLKPGDVDCFVEDHEEEYRDYLVSILDNLQMREAFCISRHQRFAEYCEELAQAEAEDRAVRDAKDS